MSAAVQRVSEPQAPAAHPLRTLLSQLWAPAVQPTKQGACTPRAGCEVPMIASLCTPRIRPHPPPRRARQTPLRICQPTRPNQAASMAPHLKAAARLLNICLWATMWGAARSTPTRASRSGRSARWGSRRHFLADNRTAPPCPRCAATSLLRRSCRTPHSQALGAEGAAASRRFAAISRPTR